MKPLLGDKGDPILSPRAESAIVKVVTVATVFIILSTMLFDIYFMFRGNFFGVISVVLLSIGSFLVMRVTIVQLRRRYGRGTRTKRV
jgi:hypothetical protein